MRRSRKRIDPAKQKAMRAKLDARTAATRQRIAERKKRLPKRERRRPSRWWLLVILLLILLLLLRDCACSPPPEGPTTPVPQPAVEVVLEEVEPEPPPRASPRIARRDRPEFATAKPEPPAWIAAFRMQVSARSPRLAECFEGTARPGRLKWTTSVEPVDGAVSEHVIDPMLTTNDLSAAERACVVGVLESPPYRLTPGEEKATPSRVGLVIEF